MVDNSGMRLYITPSLRDYEAGSLTIGHTVDPVHVIGPKSQHWLSMGHCTSDCTTKVIYHYYYYVEFSSQTIHIFTLIQISVG